MRRTLLLVSLLVLGTGVAVAQAVTVSIPTFTATATATIKPKALPAKGRVPVKLDVKATTSQPGSLGTAIRDFELVLDGQLRVDTTGLPVCTADLSTADLDTALKLCGKAEIGHGAVIERIRVPEAFPPTYDVFSYVRFFNGLDGRRKAVLMYVSSSTYTGSVSTTRFEAIGNGNRFRFPGTSEAAGLTEANFHFGATWKYKGKTRSYLNGECRKGTLKNKLTLTLDDGTVSADAAPVRCGKGG